MELANAFLAPQNTAHRQYEALRAYFVERRLAAEVAQQFGYTVGSFHQLAHQFRRNPQRAFFVDDSRPGVKSEDSVRQTIIELRKQNQSIYDISRALAKEDIERTPSSVAQLLKEEGFGKLPRRADDERPESVRPVQADRADARALSTEPRTIHTKFGGLFLFLPAMVEMGFNRVIGHCGLPGSKMVPAAHAMRRLLALKLQSNRRHTHVMSAVLDEGLALFAGLNVIPKRSFLTEYSCRIEPRCHEKRMRHWFDAMVRLGLVHGSSFDLDFHTIPCHGDDPLLEKHYVSKRSRRQKGILAFLAQDSEQRFFCYANTDLRKEQQNDEILQFVKYWKARTGQLPEELVFDSKLTTDGVNLFPMDSLSRAVPLKVHCDVPLTMMASSLYRHLAQRIGSGYEKAKSAHLFRDFIDAAATIEIDETSIWVHFQKRAHNPLLLAAEFHKTDVRIPWLRKRLRFVFG